jgi:hypothetical protein
MTSDVIDQANERAQVALDAAIAAARNQPKTHVQPVFCLNECGERTQPAALYCCEECKSDHEARQATLRRKGVR